jgi:hypothetical protein
LRTLKVVGKLTEVPKTRACCLGRDGSRFGLMWFPCVP